MLRDTDDPNVFANAVEELLRYLSIIQNGQRRSPPRTSTSRASSSVPAKASSSTTRRRTGIPKEFSEPDRLYLHRSGAGQHVAFGYGRHQCVGQQLARAELQIVFHTLLRRVPTLELAVPIEDVPLKHDRLAYGVYELPVTW